MVSTSEQPSTHTSRHTQQGAHKHKSKDTLVSHISAAEALRTFEMQRAPGHRETQNLTSLEVLFRLSDLNESQNYLQRAACSWRHVPSCILSGILLCSRAASGIKHSRSLSGNLLKNKYTQPLSAGALFACMSLNMWHSQRSSALGERLRHLLLYAQAHLHYQSFANTDAPRVQDLHPQTNKPSLACKTPPDKDCDCIFTREPKELCAMGGPSQLKEQADRRVNLAQILMCSREHSRGLNTNCDDEEEVCLGRKGEALWSSLETLNRSSQTPGMLAGEKNGNNSQRECALHNKTCLRLFSDKVGSTLEKPVQRQTRKRMRPLLTLRCTEHRC